MKIDLRDAHGGLLWLTDPNWVVYNDGSDPDLNIFIENTCFPPGTPKNAEYEIAVIPLLVNGENKITFWIRWLDTVENRKAFACAMELYRGQPLATQWEDHLADIREMLRLELEIRNNRLAWKGIIDNSWGSRKK